MLKIKVAIIDADLIGRKKHRFPNLACMKLSSYYKSIGADVELKLDYENLDTYDKVTISKVFMDTEIPFEPDDKSLKTEDTIDLFYKDNPILNLPNVEYGGTGFYYDRSPKLSVDIEHIMPDYHLYDDWVTQQIEKGTKPKDLTYYTDWSIGFNCYDERTEILTDKGWRLFKNLDKTEKVLTLNPETQQIEWHKPYEYVNVTYSGDMYYFKNKYVDLMVTPNHNMYINKYKNYELISAEQTKNYYKYKFKKDGVWIGEEQKYFYFDKCKKIASSKILEKLPMDLFLEFLGYYLSEGCVQYKPKTRSYIVRISQNKTGKHNSLKEDVFSKIEICLKNLGYSYYKNDKEGFFISNKQLYSYCKQFGLQPERFVPNFVKQLSPRQIKIFIDAYVLGDGAIYQNKSGNLTVGIISSSKRIVDDFQELFLKIGGCGDIHCYTKTGDVRHIEGRDVVCKHDIYTIILNNYYKRPMFSKQNSQVMTEKYNGNIYCVEVENHIIYVRRNGKAVWCGNTRGCIRQCAFCVNKNYKKCELHSSLSEFVDESRPYICLLDDNVLACPKWREVFEELARAGKRFQFKQGVDERLLTDEKCEVLFNCKWIGDRIFAFDNIKDKDLIINRLEMIRRHTKQVIKFYTFCAFNHDNPNHYDEAFYRKDIEDLLERVKILMEYGCLPYIMRYKDYEISPYRGIYITISRWCNQPSFFKKKSLREFAEANQARTKIKCADVRNLEQIEKDFPDIAEKYFDMKFENLNRFKG